MKKSAVALTCMWLLALVPTASASPYNRNCGKPSDGWVVGQYNPVTQNYPYVVKGPWHINMTRRKAAQITKRFPPGEFNSHIPLSETPCIVGQSIASSASGAWSQWKANNGWVKVKAHTSGGTTYIGRFYCTGHSVPGAVVKETCTMHYRGGKMIGSFKIYDNSNG